jgi:molecular chaperone GrpE
MKNNIHSEQESEKNAESELEAGNIESPDSTKSDPKSISQDPAKKLQDELAESKEKYLRLYAEFDNFRRRTAKEKIEMIQSANEELVKLLLPVMDDFERGEKSFSDKSTKEAEGFFLIQNKFKKILEQTGIKIMDAVPGGEFNADLHEAITQIPAPSEKLKGKIVDVVDKGYLLNDKVIRFAKVVVGN